MSFCFKVVFMGMGEPLDNFENVSEAVKVMSDHAFGLALKRLCMHPSI